MHIYASLYIYASILEKIEIKESYILLMLLSFVNMHIQVIWLIGYDNMLILFFDLKHWAYVFVAVKTL